MIARTHRNTKRNSNRFHNPAPDAIPDLWRELSAMESIAPAGLRGGLARRRTALLDFIPSWQLSEVLDSLIREGVTT